MYCLLLQRKNNILLDEPPTQPLILMCYSDSEQQYQEYILHTKKEIPSRMEYQENIKKLVIYMGRNTFSCNLNGEEICDITLEEHAKEEVFNPFSFYSMIEIKQIGLSINQKYVYITSSWGFDICDKKTGRVLYSKEYGFGAENFIEIEENILVVCKYSGNSVMYKIQD
jgi:hypothetical protein